MDRIKMDCGKSILGKDVRVLAFPALCAGATIAFVIVIQMTYIVDDYPRLDVDKAFAPKPIKVQEALRLEGDSRLLSKLFPASQESIQEAVSTEKSIHGWLLTAVSEVEETRINQTELLHSEREFFKWNPPLVVSERTGTKYLMKETKRKVEHEFSLDIDIVKELHLEELTDGNSPLETLEDTFPFPSEFHLKKTFNLKLDSLQNMPDSLQSGPVSVRDVSSQEDLSQYNIPKPKSAPQHHKVVVPKIVHVIWFTAPENCTFRFHQFISLLSVHKFIQPHRIFFWHNNAPCGTWWNATLRNVSNIAMMQIEPPSSVFGHEVFVLEHKTDVLRISLLLRYGGIYIDLDVVVLKSWDPLLYYDTTLGAENPNLLGSGVIISVKLSRFMRLWYDSYRAFNDKLWNFNCCRVPMLIANRHPELVHIEWDTIHRPSWTELDYLYTAGKLWDWSVNYGVHLWYRFHKVEHDPEDIRTLNTTMGELFRYVYYGTADFVL